MTRELAELREAGMKPTAGDMRCIAYGHITRMAIWTLRSCWDAGQSTGRKLSLIRSAMNSVATIDELMRCLELAPVPQPAVGVGLFAQDEALEAFDAVTF